ncbi:MAG: VanZ family protein [Oscillospiraceae bacterium]|nr:VanZ family protein [Oscillospiraceae bacterium]
MDWKGLSPRRRRLAALNGVLLAALLCFIWGNSMLGREQSSQESAAVLELVEPVLEMAVGQGNVTEHLVRKLAHFTEFAALGALGVSLLALLGAGRGRRLAYALPFGLVCAAMDEGIQIFSDRGNQISDVALDFSGCLTGALLMWLLVLAAGRLRRRRNRRYSQSGKAA